MCDGCTFIIHSVQAQFYTLHSLYTRFGPAHTAEVLGLRRVKNTLRNARGSQVCAEQLVAIERRTNDDLRFDSAMPDRPSECRQAGEAMLTPAAPPLQLARKSSSSTLSIQMQNRFVAPRVARKVTRRRHFIRARSAGSRRETRTQRRGPLQSRAPHERRRQLPTRAAMAAAAARRCSCRASRVSE